MLRIQRLLENFWEVVLLDMKMVKHKHKDWERGMESGKLLLLGLVLVEMKEMEMESIMEDLGL